MTTDKAALINDLAAVGRALFWGPVEIDAKAVHIYVSACKDQFGLSDDEANMLGYMIVMKGVEED